jgi:RNase P/RNase MRP subunit p30
MEALSGSMEEIRKQADKLKKENKKVIVLARDIEFNRKILEMKKVNALVLQHKLGKDKLKQRDSGLNQVLCEIARKNNITLAIDFSEILASEGREKAKVLSRIMQNLKLARKYKNKLVILNKPRDSRSLQSLFLVLGADTKLASQLVN